MALTSTAMPPLGALQGAGWALAASRLRLSSALMLCSTAASPAPRGSPCLSPSPHGPPAVPVPRDKFHHYSALTTNTEIHHSKQISRDSLE